MHVLEDPITNLITDVFSMTSSNKKSFLILILASVIGIFIISRPMWTDSENKHVSEGVASIEKPLSEVTPDMNLITKKMYPDKGYEGPIVKIKLPSNEKGMQPAGVYVQNMVSHEATVYSVDGAHYLEIAVGDQQVGFRTLGRGVRYRIKSGNLSSTFVIPPDSGDVALISPEWDDEQKQEAANKDADKKVIRISGCDAYVGMVFMLAGDGAVKGSLVPENGLIEVSGNFETLKQIAIYKNIDGLISAVFFSSLDDVNLQPNQPNQFEISQFNNLTKAETKPCSIVVNAEIPRSEVHFYINETDALPMLAIDTAVLKNASYDVPAIANFISYPKGRDKKEIMKGAKFGSFEVVAP